MTGTITRSTNWYPERTLASMVLIVLLVVVLAAVAMTAWAGSGWGGGMMGYYGGSGWGWMAVAGAVVMALVLVFVVLLVYALVRGTAPNYAPPARTDDPQNEARMRYARGEISREQYQQILRDLSPP